MRKPVCASRLLVANTNPEGETDREGEAPAEPLVPGNVHPR